MADEASELKKAQDEAARARALISGIFKDLKVDDIMKISSAFKTMGDRILKGGEEIEKVSEEMDVISRRALGVKSREEIRYAVGSIQALETAMGKNISAVTKANINKMKFEWELNAAKNAQLEMQQKNFMGSIGAAMKKQQIKILQGMEAVFGKQIASSLMKFAGPIGAGIAIFAGITMALQALFDTAQTGFKSFGTSWASAGGMVGKSAEDYIYMTAKISEGFNDFKQVGYTTKQATELVKKSMTEMSWTLGLTALQAEGFNGSLIDRTTMAADRTREFVLEMGRFSTVMFGSTENTNKFIATANLYNLTLKTAKVFATGIGKMSGELSLDAGLMMDSINNMGKTMLGTGVNGIDRLSQSFIPLLKNIKSFGEAEKMSTYEINQMLKGVETLSKGVDTFTYLAASGKGLESYESAQEVDALTRAKSLIGRFNDLNAGVASIALNKGFGLFGDMSEAMRIKMVKVFRKYSPEELKGKNSMDIAREALNVKPGEEDVQTQIASGILSGQNLQEQMVDTLIKLLRVVTTGVLGFMVGNKHREARESIKQLTEDKQAITRTGSSQYSVNVQSAMGM